MNCLHNWEYVRIGDVCTVERGGSPRPIEQFITDDPNGINWIKIGDTNDSMYITSTAQKIVPEGMKKSRYVQPGDFLLSNSMSFGRPYILKIDGCIHDGWLVLRDDNGLFDKKFLYYYLSAPSTYQKFKNMAVGGVVNNLNSDMVRKVTVPVPTMEEQVTIVSVLDRVTRLIAMRKEQLAKLDELVKARFVELFIGKGYPTKTVDEVSLGKGEYGAQSASVGYDPTRPRYVRITDINDDGTLNDDVVASINPADDKQYKLEYGDFMFARMGATVGKTYAFIEGNQIFAGYLIRYRLNQKLINPRYLFWYTKLDEYWNWVKLNQSGAAQPGINAKKFGSLQIPLPSIEEQNAFAAFVEQTNKTKLTIQSSLDKLEVMKKALMQEYFG